MPDKTSPARLIIADDHDLVRDGIRAMLTREPDLEVAGEARDGEETLELCRDLRPDLVLTDVRMPKMDGLAATREIKAECPKATVLIVTTHENPDYLLDAIKAGISQGSRGMASTNQFGDPHPGPPEVWPGHLAPGRGNIGRKTHLQGELRPIGGLRCHRAAARAG